MDGQKLTRTQQPKLSVRSASHHEQCAEFAMLATGKRTRDMVSFGCPEVVFAALILMFVYTSNGVISHFMGQNAYTLF